MPQKHPKIFTNLQNIVNVLNGGIWHCLKHEQDNGSAVRPGKAMSKQPSGKIPP